MAVLNVRKRMATKKCPHLHCLVSAPEKIAHLASLLLALSNPYAIAGEGFIHTDDAPAMAAVAVATLSMNPRRFKVLLSTSSDMESEDLTET